MRAFGVSLDINFCQFCFASNLHALLWEYRLNEDACNFNVYNSVAGYFPVNRSSSIR